MPATQITDKLYNWASDIENDTLLQAAKTSRLPIVEGHVALMPDAHVGMGSTVGSVVPTKGAVIPSCVGVDIGCGMIAAETTLRAVDLPNLDPFLSVVEQVVPAGVGQGHEHASNRASTWLRDHKPASELDTKQATKAAVQFGTLGSGNHFAEVCLDEKDNVWLVLHSGSRGIGNELAMGHIKRAKGLAKELQLRLEDPDLSYFLEGTPEFQHYITDMLWAQDYALQNREAMMAAFLSSFFKFVGYGRELKRINCHHNFTQLETHPLYPGSGLTQDLWITRKGAIKADIDDWGIIPGSMGTRSYIVQGKGSPWSWNSCSHGAGRRMSRSAAKKQFTTGDLEKLMEGKTWLKGKAQSLVDEIPSSYKDIDQVMADQTDLVEVKHTLRQVLNYKGA
jgi:tRNA-splicing ligase RtcB (3'-phosphate/5'-hydroxy nucleic acid ligase)